MRYVLTLTVSAMLALLSSAARAEIGTVNFAIGNVSIIGAQGTRAGVKGELINEGDTILVGSGSAQLKMVDGGFLAIRPDTQMKFDQYKWSGREDGTERGVMSLVRGGFRAITGAIGRINKNNYRVSTPTATVGIRGTDHEILYMPAGPAAGAGAPVSQGGGSLALAQSALSQVDIAPFISGPVFSLTPVLLAQAGPGGGGGVPAITIPPGTYDKVNVGIARITSQGVSVDVRPNQVGYAPPNVAPRLLPAVPSFLRAATPPRPQQQQQQQQQQQGQGEGQQQAQQGQQQGQQAAQQGQGEGQQQAQQGQQQGQQAAQQGQQQGQAAAPAQQQAAAPAQAVAEPLRVSAGVDSPAQVATASATATQSVPTTPMATTVVVAITPVATSGQTSSGGSTNTTTTTTNTTPVVLTSSTGLTANLTSNTVTTTSGSSVPISQGTTAADADLAAAAAVAAANALDALLLSAGGLATQQLPTAINAATPVVTAAQTASTSAAALSISTASAIANAASIASITTSTQTAAANATAVYTGNGAFADATLATPAKNVMTTANSLVQSANTTVQTAAGTVQSLAGALGGFQTSGAATLAGVNSALASANASLSTLTALGVTTTAQSQLSIAQTAASNAQMAATHARAFQDAGDLTSAQSELAFAQQQQAIAANALSVAASIIGGITAAQAAAAGAGTVSDVAADATVFGLANAAQAAVTSAATELQKTDAALTTPTPSAANAVLTQAQIVTVNAPIAQYSNPAVASPPDGFGFVTLASKANGTGREEVIIKNKNSLAGETFVLDGAKSLVRVRNAEKIEANGFNFTDATTDTTVSMASRFMTLSGGTAQDVFKAADNSVYLGRWQGGTVDLYSDIGLGGGNTLLESIALGSSSAHWLVALNPAANYVQKLTGTANYSLAAATRPTDAFGNVGTLNSASIAANFSALSASAHVNLSFSGARTLTIDAQTPDVPIRDNGFVSDTGSAYAPIISCSGAGCVVSNPAGGTTSGVYHGGIKGGFGGLAAAGGVLGYQFIPDLGTVPATTPHGDLIQGVAALSSASNPVVGASPAAVGATGEFRFQSEYSTFGTGGTKFLARERTPTGSLSLSNTAFVFDASGNLAHVTGARWNVFSTDGNNVQCTLGTPCLNPTSLASGDSVSIFSMGGGTLGALGSLFNVNADKSSSSAAELYFDASTGIRFGRYQGGLVNPTSDVDGFASALESLGSRSVLWAIREVPSSIPVTGTWQYYPTAATAPADTFGNTGTLNYARLGVNFSNQTVDPAVGVSINNQDLTAWGQSVPIGVSGANFDVTSSATINAGLAPAPAVPLTVTCTGSNCAPAPVNTAGEGYGARITGGFAGDATAGGAFFRYVFNTRYDPTVAAGSGLTGAAPAGRIANDYIDGLVGFSRGTQLALPAIWPKTALTSYFWWPASTALVFGSNDKPSVNHFDSEELTATFTGPNGNLDSVSESTGGRSQTLGGDTAGADTVTTLANGISFGRYSAQNIQGTGTGLTISGQDSTGSFSSRQVLGSYQWIAAPTAWPIFSGNVMAGSATYSVAGSSLPTDQNNFTGTLTSALLSVNFDQQSVNTALDILMPANATNGGTFTRHWTATASNVRLDDGGGFNAGGNSGTYAHNDMTVTLNGSSNNTLGEIQGQLTGALMNGAALAYTLAGPDISNSGQHEHVNGVVAFGTPAFLPVATPDVMKPYYIRLGAQGTVTGYDANTGALSSATPAAAVDEKYLTHVTISALDANRVTLNSAGNPVEIDAIVPVVTNAPTCSPSCFVNQTPVRVGIVAAGTAASGAIPAMPAITGTAAGIPESGIDAATGIRWGRYSNGDFAIVDRVSGTSFGSGNSQIGPINHYLLSPVQSGPTVLPASGTFNYTLVGGTLPTNSAGIAGTLNSATLVANFGTQKVDMAVNATVNGTTFAASAVERPIIAATGFEASKSVGGSGSLTVNCTGTCGATTAGQIIGAFTGTTGQGAGLAYTLNTGAGPNASSNLPTSGGITIGGVAAFKR